MMEHVCFLGSRKRCGLWVLVANVRVQLILSADDCRRLLILGLGNYSPVLVSLWKDVKSPKAKETSCFEMPSLPYCSSVKEDPSSKLWGERLIGTGSRSNALTDFQHFGPSKGDEWWMMLGCWDCNVYHRWLALSIKRKPSCSHFLVNQFLSQHVDRFWASNPTKSATAGWFWTLPKPEAYHLSHSRTREVGGWSWNVFASLGGAGRVFPFPKKRKEPLKDEDLIMMFPSFMGEFGQVLSSLSNWESCSLSIFFEALYEIAFAPEMLPHRIEKERKAGRICWKFIDSWHAKSGVFPGSSGRDATSERSLAGERCFAE